MAVGFLRHSDYRQTPQNEVENFRLRRDSSSLGIRPGETLS